MNDPRRSSGIVSRLEADAVEDGAQVDEEGVVDGADERFGPPGQSCGLDDVGPIVRLQGEAEEAEDQAAGPPNGENSSGQSSLDHGRCSVPAWRPDDPRPAVAPK